MTVTQELILESLNSIIDPCSAAMGAPSGLVDMGMVETVLVTPCAAGFDILVELLMTEAGCLMSVPFRVTAEEAIADLPGVNSVAVRITTSTDWTEERMTDSLRLRLSTLRNQRRKELGMPEFLERTDA